MASTQDADLGEGLARIQAAAMELSRLQEVPQIANRALEWALELTDASVVFISLTKGVAGEALIYRRATDRSLDFSNAEVSSFVGRAMVNNISASSPVELIRNSPASARGRATPYVCLQPLDVAGRRLGVMGVASASGYTEIERRTLAIFASQLAAVIEIAGLRQRRHEMVEALINMRANLDGVEKQKLIESTQKEIASELHDDALQKLTASGLHLERLKDLSDHDASVLAEAQSLLAQTEESIRHLLFEARPPALEDPGGLEESIRQRIESLRSLTNARVDLELDLPVELSAESKAMTYRQVAEALSNIERHAEATHVRLSMKAVDGAVHGLVSDNGRGFVVSERSNLPGHLGLRSLEERAILAGGWYKIDSEPGAGTRIEFWLPIA